MEDSDPETVKAAPVRVIGADRTVSTGERALVAEVPVAICFCGLGYAVMMATPSDLEDFATGFALAERLIDRREDIIEIDLRAADEGMLLSVELAPALRERVFERVRHRVGESSCGLCGIENLEQALRPLPVVGPPGEIAAAALFRAVAGLSDHQPLNRETGGAHAAAWCAADGSILAAREDVGRHNAFDKLIGHCLADGVSMADGFVLLTARCSYELVEKAAIAGVSLLVSVSVPTSLAVARAKEAKLTLVSLARADSMLVVSDPYGRFGPTPAHTTHPE